VRGAREPGIGVDSEDRRFIRRLQRREEAAFTELVERYQARIYALVLRMLGDPEEARDVAQEVFISVFRRVDGFRGDAQLSTWMYRVAVNHTKNRLKYLGRRARGRTQEVDAVPEGVLHTAQARVHGAPPRPDQEAEARQMLGIVQAALAKLDPDFRALVVLRDRDGLSYGEISEVTGQPVGTVKSRLHRARMALKAALEEQTK
jgi:RNA polymerase sigma-70 factor (ECF subfamily)